MDKIQCSDCDKEFFENDIAYICDECGKHYCFKCYCNGHFEIHSIWRPVIVKDGELVPLDLNKLIE